VVRLDSEQIGDPEVNCHREDRASTKAQRRFVLCGQVKSSESRIAPLGTIAERSYGSRTFGRWDALEKNMKLTEEQKQQFDWDGYLFFRL
jgi:hypothetical protein